MDGVGTFFCPTVLVVQTPDAATICQKNGLSFTDLLRPHGDLSAHVVTSRHLSEQLVQLRGFAVRFVDVTDLNKARLDDPLETLQREVRDTEDTLQPPFVSCAADVSAYIHAVRAAGSTPWYARYRLEYMEQMRLSEQECFDHPVAAILVCSSEQQDAINTMMQLYNPQNPPELYREGFMDPNLCKYYILLHDDQGPVPLDAATSMFQKMKTVFGLGSCKLLRINSASPPLQEVNDIWTMHRPRRPGPPPAAAAAAAAPVGALLSAENIADIAATVLVIVQQHVIPHMERRIRVINDQVASQRKGFGKWAKRWLAGKTKDERNQEDSNHVYPHNSVEMQIRLMADYAFMLRDFPLACSMYRLIHQDFKNANAYKYYGATQEFIAISLHFSEPMSKEIPQSFEQAIQAYGRCGLGRHARRATMLLYDILLRRQLFNDAAHNMARLTSPASNDLGAALALEQVALCFLNMKPYAAFRKYAFYLYQAGERYHQCGQRRHAMRCFERSLAVYEDHGWSLIETSIHHNIAQEKYHLGSAEGASQSLLNVIASTSQTAGMQQTYLEHFASVVGALDREMSDLPLPEITNESLEVFFNQCEIADSHAGTPNDQWRDMERDVVKKCGSPGVFFEEHPQRHIVVVREPVTVQVVLRNPLKIPLLLQSLQLQCLFTPPTEEDGSDEVAFDASVLEAVLPPGESHAVTLCVTPLREGNIRVLGLKFLLNGKIRGSRPFQLRGKRLNKTKTQRTSREYAPDIRLDWHVIRGMPCLDAQIMDFPSEILNSGVVRATLELSNVGDELLTSLVAKVSHPSCFSFGGAPLEGEDVGPREGVAHSTHTLNNTLYDPSVTRLPLNLKPGERARIPVWVRGCAGIGSHHFAVLLFYEPVSLLQPSSLKYRTARLSLRTTIAPSLRLRSFVLPCANTLHETTLGLEVTNHLARDVCLTQLTSVSMQWYPLALGRGPDGEGGGEAESDSLVIAPIRAGESTSMYFRVLRVHDSVVEGGDEVVVHHTHVPLRGKGPVEETRGGPVFDLMLRDKMGRRPAKRLKARTKNLGLAIDNPDDVDEDSLLFYENTLDVMLGWETGGSRGQFNIVDITLGPSHDRNRPDPKPVIPLKLCLEFQGSVVHDFSTTGHCVVPVVLHCMNIHPTAKLSVTFDGSLPGGAHASADLKEQEKEQEREQALPFMWAGKLRATLPGLERNGTQTLRLQAVFLRTGTYNLCRFRLVVHAEGEQPRTHAPNLNYFITITSPPAQDE